jgi:hypothetical protein
MAQVLQFRRRLNVFAPQVTAAMGDVYDEAISRLHGGTGETNPHRLRDAALSGVRSPRAA